MMKKVQVDKEKCLGCGLCANIASKTFERDADGKMTVKEGEHDADGSIRTAAQMCPQGAITFEE